MSSVLNDSDRAALQAYSHGDLSAIELRRRLNDATFGDVLALLRAEGLKLPRAPVAGREEQLARARAWLFLGMAKLKLFVVDTGPLITLAAAGALDYLLYVDTDVVIPDAVLYEATFDAARLGAQDILDWVTANRRRIELAPTRAYVTFEAARVTLPALREAGLGERAAVEVIEAPDRLRADEHAVLLCEESAVLKRVIVRDRARIVELSTLDFLRLLEEERRIQSCEQVFEAAEQAGRKSSRVEKIKDCDQGTQDAVRALLRGSEGV